MKGMKKVGLMLAVFVFMAAGAVAAVVGKPVVLPDAMVSITVSDLHGMIDGVGGIAAQVSPAVNGMMLKSMLGMQVGDPGLAGIAPGKGLSVVALDQTNVFAVIEVDDVHAPAYGATLLEKGIPSKYVGGMLVVAPSADQLAQAEALIPSVESTLLAKRSPSLRIVAQPAALFEKNKEKIDSMMLLMPMMMGMGMPQSPGMDPAAMEQPLKILEGEMRFLLSLAGQCEALEIALAPQNGSLRITETLVPKAGSELAALVNAPVVNKPNPRIQAGLLGKGAISLDCTMANPEALNTFFSKELDDVLKAMGINSENLAKITENMKKWMALYNGSCSEVVGFGGDSFMNISYVLEVKDEAQALTLFRSMNEAMAPFLELYKSLGMLMSFEFKENEREHSGVNIHQLKVHMSMSQEQMNAMGAMNMNLSNMVYDVAICDGLMLYSMGDTKIETLIDRVKDADLKPSPLTARSVYPANASYYCDFDVAAYLSGISTFLPKDPANTLPQIAALLQGADPVTSAGYCEDGAVMWSINIPGSLIGRIGQAVVIMQMQQMQQQMQQVPQATPPAMEPVAVPGTMPGAPEADAVE